MATVSLPVAAPTVRSTHPIQVGQVLWSISLVTLLAVVIPSVVLRGAQAGDGRAAGFAAILLLAVWSGARLALVIASGAPRMYEFTTWLFIYVFFGLAGSVQLGSETFPSTTPGIEVDLTGTATGLVWIGVAGLELGLFAARRSRFWVIGQPSRATVSFERAQGLALVGLVCCAYYVSAVGLGAMFGTREMRDRVAGSVWPDSTIGVLVGVAAYVPALVALHAMVQARRAQRTAGERPRGAALIIVLLVSLALVSNPVTSARYSFGTVALSLLFLAGGFSQVRRARLSMLLVAAVFIAVFPYSDAFRTERGGSNGATLGENYASNGDYDAFAQLINTVEVVERGAAPLGQQALGVAFFFVPRSQWAGKPTDTGIFLARSKDYGFENLSAPIWAELYVNGRTPAVFVGFVLVGLLLGRLSIRMRDDLTRRSIGAVFGGIVSFYLLLLLRGSLLQAFSTLSVLVVCVLALRGRRNAPTDASA